jgi:hypothetical protein
MKATEMLNKVKNLLGVEASEEIKEQETQLESQEIQEETLAEDTTKETSSKKVELETAELENGTIVEADSFESGNEVFIVTDDERVALPVGEYILVNGDTLIVKEEGIIESVGTTEESPEEEVQAEEEKEVSNYATKEELAEVKKAVDEIVSMIEELSYGKKEEMTSEEIDQKENLSEVEKVKHNPESEEKTQLKIPSSNGTMNTLDRVMQTISNFN